MSAIEFLPSVPAIGEILEKIPGIPIMATFHFPMVPYTPFGAGLRCRQDRVSFGIHGRLKRE
jgi:hypothetical protein